MDKKEEMTLEELYTLMQGDYADAKRRLMKDERIEKYLRIFLRDETMQQLNDAVNHYDDNSDDTQQQRETIFRAAHTMKGVAANLSLTTLAHAASELTEQMRDRQNAPSALLVDNLRKAYDTVIKAYSQKDND